MVGERRVAGQDGAVEVGADDPPEPGALGPLTVAAAGDHATERHDAGAEGGAPPVVLEAGEAGERRRGVDDDLADQAGRAGAGLEVEEPDPVELAAVGREVAVPEQLVAAADAEHDGAGGDGRLDVRP